MVEEVPPLRSPDEGRRPESGEVRGALIWRPLPDSAALHPGYAAEPGTAGHRVYIRIPDRLISAANSPTMPRRNESTQITKMRPVSTVTHWPSSAP